MSVLPPTLWLPVLIKHKYIPVHSEVIAKIRRREAWAGQASGITESGASLARRGPGRYSDPLPSEVAEPAHGKVGPPSTPTPVLFPFTAQWLPNSCVFTVSFPRGVWVPAARIRDCCYWTHSTSSLSHFRNCHCKPLNTKRWLENEMDIPP